MDQSRFDQLTREAATSLSRRHAVKYALGATVAAFGVNKLQKAGAVSLRGTGEICRKDAECATGACGVADRTGRRFCICTNPEQCPPPPEGFLATCSETGRCGV